MAFTGLCTGTAQILKTREARGFTAFYICLGISFTVVLRHEPCGRQSIVDSGRFPERFQVRSQGATKAVFVWGSMT